MKLSKGTMKWIVVIIGALFVLEPLVAFAQGDFYVIPVAVNKALKNVVTVAKANGKFTDPVAAVASITDASATNPYLVVIGPGVYTITSPLQMKPYVDIAGCGENVTRITGAISTAAAETSAIVLGADNAALSSLTVENTGGGNVSIALYNHYASPMVKNVVAKAIGGGSSYGVRNHHSSPKLIGVTAIGSGQTIGHGVHNYYYSSPPMTNVAAEGSGTNSCGVYNFTHSSPTMTGVTAMGGLGGNSYGVYNLSVSHPTIRRSTIAGTSYAIYIADDYNTAMVSQSTIVGRVNGSKCVACDDYAGNALDGNCQ
mgnify:CR=1 FL=1